MPQPPFGKAELSKPPLEGEAYVQLLRDQRAKKCPEPPPLYRDLFAGSLSREHLLMWIKDMYPYWDNLYYIVGCIFVKTNQESVRTNMLRRLVDVEGKVIGGHLSGKTTPAYEELWLRFGEEAGLTRDNILSWHTFTRTHFTLDALNTYSRFWEWSWLDGIASFYAADLHWTDYLGRTYEALRQHYRIPVEALEFFPVFLEDVASHISWEEDALKEWACTTERQLTAARAFRERLDMEDQLVVGVDQARSQSRLPHQVPWTAATRLTAAPGAPARL